MIDKHSYKGTQVSPLLCSKLFKLWLFMPAKGNGD